MSNKTYSINSLSDFINLIEKEEFNNCIYRGERRKHKGIKSTLVRDYKPNSNFDGLSGLFDNLLINYYQEVGYELDELQKEFFIAFSQHHGLKTNLIDFTTAPLVALFFACDRAHEENGKGYVYGIVSKSTIDATTFLNEFCFKKQNHFNLFNQLLWNENNISSSFSSLINRIDAFLSLDATQSLYCDTCYYINSRDYTHKCQSFLYEYSHLGDNASLSEKAIVVHKYAGTFKPIVFSYSDIYTVLLMLFLFDLTQKDDDNEAIGDFPPIPYLIYRTPLKFDRIKNQNGVFIYQCFYDYCFNVEQEKYNGFSAQEIIPDFTIEINNQSKILKELDLVGINRRYVYGDFDNTAEYINQKYFKM